MFEILRGLRAELAKKEGIPPYIIFPDKPLVHMCVIRPVNRNEMLSVSGEAGLDMRNMGSVPGEGDRIF